MVAFEMVTPALIGVCLDWFWGTVALFTIIGMVLGVVLGFWQLIKIAVSEDVSGVDKSPDIGDNGKV